MLQILKAADRLRHHLGGVHVCTTLIPKPELGSPPGVLVGITDAILMPGEYFEDSPPPPATHTVLTFMLEGIAQRSPCQGSQSRLTPGSSQIEPSLDGNHPTGTAQRWHNPSPDKLSRLLQFWISRCPPAGKLKPTAQTAPLGNGVDGPRLLACPKGSATHLRAPLGMALWQATLHHGQRWRRTLGNGHHAWVTVTAGEVWCCGKLLSAGDAALAHEEPCLRLQARRPAQLFVLEFDV
ncbi:hypothetical protein [Verrucomicrobium sp. BvORR106]|uniref:pirin family protein n=1 Tax=Verrucomicrobium sp. BvORR106 TaxID=1403819 RepID=UPI00056E72EE|nr:hypothetical protein [Verrucomicrobium sp. BvORR106]